MGENNSNEATDKKKKSQKIKTPPAVKFQRKINDPIKKWAKYQQR